MKISRYLIRSFHQIFAVLLIAALLLPNFGLTRSAGAFSFGGKELQAALVKFRSAVANLPSILFSNAVKKNLESEIAELKEVIERGEHCRAVKLIDEILGGVGKLREGARITYAEDLHNQGWALRHDVITLIPKGDPCDYNPRFNQAPAINVFVSDNKHLSAKITFGEPKMWTVSAEKEIFTELQIPGVENGDGQAGFPGVPVFHKLVAVPQGSKATLNFKPGNVRTFKVNLYPVQPEAADVAKDKNPQLPKFENPPFTKNKAAYETNAGFPSNICSVTPVGKAREVEVARVTCAVGQYNPVTDVLRLYESIDFEIIFEGGKGGFVPQSSSNPFDNQLAYLASLVNAEAVFKFQIPDLRSYICFGEEYLILTHPDFRSAADRLAKWKNDKGIVTRVMEVMDGRGGSGPDTKEKIDALIESRYGRCLTRVSYVLLLGDAEFIPTFYRDTFGSPTTGTDYPYALLGDDDETPDFALGRIPVDTIGQADIVVDKIIKYESDPPSLNSFYQNVGVASQFQCCRTDVTQDGRDQRWFIETTELVRNHLLDEGYGAERIYTRTTASNYDGDSTPARFYDGTLLPEELRESSGFDWAGDTDDIIDAWNAGRFLFYHRDHGWQYGFAHPSFQSENVVNDLNNGELLPVVFSVNCASGLFDNETADGDYTTDVDETYFAEHLLRKPDGGAVGILGDTRNSPTGPNNVLTKGFFDAVWPELLPDFGESTRMRRLGDILNHGKFYLISQYGLPAVTEDLGANGLSAAAASELYLWHVLGDPTLEMWTSKPKRWLINQHFLQLVNGNLKVKYQIELASITAFQESRDGVIPIGRGVVKNGEAILQLVNQPQPGVKIQLAAASRDDVSVRLTK